jgi:hypothetical protein
MKSVWKEGSKKKKKKKKKKERKKERKGGGRKETLVQGSFEESQERPLPGCSGVVLKQMHPGKVEEKVDTVL